MHRQIVSPAHKSDQPASTILRLGQAPSSKLWTGEADMQTDNLNLTLYIFKFGIPWPSYLRKFGDWPRWNTGPNKQYASPGTPEWSAGLAYVSPITYRESKKSGCP